MTTKDKIYFVALSVLACLVYVLAGMGGSMIVWVCRKILRWKHGMMGHDWRPALSSTGPCRWCICGANEELTTEEFYAHFGIMPRIGVIGR